MLECGDLFCFAYIVVQDRDGKEGRAKTATLMLPGRVRDLVEDGVELGTATDMVFARHNSKQGSGCVGSLTRDVVTRETYYERPCVLALVPFMNEELFSRTDPV